LMILNGLSTMTHLCIPTSKLTTRFSKASSMKLQTSQLLQVLNGSKDIKTDTNPRVNCPLKPSLTASLIMFALTLTTIFPET
jgi:hypothetical protein